MNANMASMAALVDVAWDKFDPWRIQAVRHRLSDHPLLQRELVELGKRFRCNPRLLTFNNEADAAANFDAVARLYHNRKTVSTLVAAHGPGSHLPACPSLAHHSAYAVAD